MYLSYYYHPQLVDSNSIFYVGLRYELMIRVNGVLENERDGASFPMILRIGAEGLHFISTDLVLYEGA